MADDNRSRILDLAVAAIDQGGEAAIRVNKIVAEVGVTPPVLYYHFGSRDGLVIAAQVERYTRKHKSDIVAIEQLVSRCTTREELHETLVAIWLNTIATNGETRWRRTNVFGSAYARPELEAAITAAQDTVFAALVAVLEPCRQRGWLRDGIDLPGLIAWQYGLLSSRVFVEHGSAVAHLGEWDRLTLETLQRAFFGD